MKKLIYPSFLILFFFNCNDNKETPVVQESEFDKENYFIIDGKTVYKNNFEGDGSKNTTSCNSPYFAWFYSKPSIGHLIIHNDYIGRIGGIQVQYYPKRVSGNTYWHDLTVALKPKVVNGKTVLQFSNLKFYDVLNTSKTKMISGKVTCN